MTQFSTFSSFTSTSILIVGWLPSLLDKAMAAKSFDKAVEVQQGYAKAASEAYMNELNKLGELYKETAKEAYKPFEASVAKFSGKAPAAK